jgi:thiol-disulfide isomerase/thioredoxin
MPPLTPIRRLTLALGSLLLLGACAGPAPTGESQAAPEVAAAESTAAEMTPEVTAEMTAEMTPEMTAEMTDEMTAEMTADAAAALPQDDPAPAVAAPARPDWHSIALTDARTGATFTLADFSGKTVFVEPFATWCTNCRQKLANVHAARQQAGDGVVFVALSVEPNVGSEALAAYAADTGYDLVYAAMPPAMLQALAAQFGQTVANPPATPHFVIGPDGSTGELRTGIETTEAILAQVAPQG